MAKNLSEENKYAQEVALDGNPLQTPFVSHKDLINGSKLVFGMGPEPTYNWK